MVFRNKNQFERRETPPSRRDAEARRMFQPAWAQPPRFFYAKLNEGAPERHLVQVVIASVAVMATAVAAVLALG